MVEDRFLRSGARIRRVQERCDRLGGRGIMPGGGAARTQQDSEEQKDNEGVFGGAGHGLHFIL
jgi:hypothetical protein